MNCLVYKGSEKYPSVQVDFLTQHFRFLDKDFQINLEYSQQSLTVI